MKYLLLALIYYITITPIFTLPISSTTATPSTTTTATTTVKDELVIATNDTFHVSIDRLSQIITTHLQFDHFDSVISNTDNVIAKEFQHHIQINIQSDNNQEEKTVLMSHGSNQYAIQQHLPTLDMMDLEILKSQIFAAIQAHTEGNLPLVWDKLADKLSKQQLESFIRQLLYDTCPTTVTLETVSSECLEENASYLADQLDTYIQQSLDHVFTLLDNDTLPNLLQHTAEDLKRILNYFNSAFLQDGKRKFVLKVIPWNSDPNDIHNFKSKLLDLAAHSTNDDNNNNSESSSHSVAFFIEYASMARL